MNVYSWLGLSSDRKGRFNLGYQDVINNFSKYTQNLSQNEIIKIISHSKGGCYAAGMAQAFIDKGYKVETILSFAPDEADDFLYPKSPKTIHIVNHNDYVVNNFFSTDIKLSKNTDYLIVLKDEKKL